MEKIINELVNEITNKLSQKMTNENGCGNVTLLVLGAYNRFQEDERDGADYIFNINDVNDLKCCIDGGMTTCEIASIYNKVKDSATTPYFFFGHNHEEAETLSTPNKLKTQFGIYLEEIIRHMLAFHDVDGYKQLYDHCIRDYMISHNLI